MTATGDTELWFFDLGHGAATVRSVDGRLGHDAATVRSVDGTLGHDAATVRSVDGTLGHDAATVRFVDGTLGHDAATVRSVDGKLVMMLPVSGPWTGRWLAIQIQELTPSCRTSFPPRSLVSGVVWCGPRAWCGIVWALCLVWCGVGL